MNIRSFIPFFVSLLACFVVNVARAQDDDNVFADAIEKAQSRCVKIYGAGSGNEVGYATGLIVSEKGHILTAQGIFLSGSRIRVVLPNGKEYPARISRRSKELQSVILKIDEITLDYFKLSEKPLGKRGDWVMAVSNLFQVASKKEQLSVNLGVLSLRTKLDVKHRTQDVKYAGDLLLVDAITSNPGASGGALIDINGNLVGMLGKLITSKSTETRLNYAVPVDLLSRFYEGKPVLVAETKVKAKGKPYLGIKFMFGAKKRSLAYIDRIVRKSPAAKAGLKPDDLIMALNGEVVHSIGDYKKAFAELRPDQEVVMLIKRKLTIQEITITPTAKKSRK